MECRKRGAFQASQFQVSLICYYSGNSCHLCVATPPVTLRTYSISWGLLLISWVFFDIFLQSAVTKRHSPFFKCEAVTFRRCIWYRLWDQLPLGTPTHFCTFFLPKSQWQTTILQIPIRMRIFVFFWKWICRVLKYTTTRCFSSSRYFLDFLCGLTGWLCFLVTFLPHMKFGGISVS